MINDEFIPKELVFWYDRRYDMIFDSMEMVTCNAYYSFYHGCMNDSINPYEEYYLLLHDVWHEDKRIVQV